MTLDRRFPWMQPLDRIENASAERAVRAICARTGCNAVYDVRRDSVHFYLGDNMQWGVCACPIAGHWDSSRIDKQVAFIYSGRKSEAMKDREMALAEAEDREAAEREKARVEDDMRPELISDTRRTMARCQMGRHWKGRALVKGSKR